MIASVLELYTGKIQSTDWLFDCLVYYPKSTANNYTWYSIFEETIALESAYFTDTAKYGLFNYIVKQLWGYKYGTGIH